MSAMQDNPEKAMSPRREKALNAVLLSIAAEETALSRVIEAESAKIQCAIKRTADLNKLMEVNRSVTTMMEKIKELQLVLKQKMALVLEHLPHDDPPDPDNPCGPNPSDDPCYPPHTYDPCLPPINPCHQPENPCPQPMDEC